MILIRE